MLRLHKSSEEIKRHCKLYKNEGFRINHSYTWGWIIVLSYGDYTCYDSPLISGFENASEAREYIKKK